MMTQQKNQNTNDVKGNAKSSNRTSPGGRLSTQQGTFYRHPVTACNTRENEDCQMECENYVSSWDAGEHCARD